MKHDQHPNTATAVLQHGGNSSDADGRLLNSRSEYITSQPSVARPGEEPALSTYTRTHTSEAIPDDSALADIGAQDEQMLSLSEELSDDAEAQQSLGITIKRLDKPTPKLTRPLSLIGEYAYAATWPHFEITQRTEVNKRGEIVPLETPRTDERNIWSLFDRTV